MSEDINSAAELNRIRINTVGRQLKALADEKGFETVANEFARRTGLEPGGARSWLSVISTDLNRRLTGTSRGIQSALHTRRLAILMEILGVPPEDKMVSSIRSIKSDFEYPPSRSSEVEDSDKNANE